ncbi:hypothetical protein CFOL_v3_34964 [Cephalotus follicularis]|uniref:DUF7746 domain-containing protein n=1 Tax=Cephalotus follicularis TaxID=3775 RepID=A0A1Q3DGI2_CEPFO|nr:hypothetical protein CFOL_v3_34964 [Cephalotus follicularis]
MNDYHIVNKLQEMTMVSNAHKIRNNSDKVPYETLTYGDIVSTITKTGLEICNDIKMGKQMKRDSKAGKKELGDFCTQFGYEPFKPPLSKIEKLQNQKRDKKYYERKQFV